MGQQQFLLIVLGVIIVGLSIAVGVSVAASSSEQSNRDAVLSDLQNLTSLTRTYYLRPTALCGGGYSFSDFIIPAELATNGNGTYEITKTSKTGDEIRIVGTGTAIGNDGTDPIKIRFKITLGEIQITKQN